MYYYVIVLATICSVTTQEESHSRLPKDLIPHHYRLDIKTDLDTSTYSGEVWITVKCLTPTQNIKLNCKKFTINNSGNNKIKVFKKADESELEISDSKHDEENDQYIITLSKPLVDGKIYIIQIGFYGNLDTPGEGFFQVSYEDESGSARMYTLTDFKIGARSVFPCFDEPHFRATFSINIGVKRPFIPISNMPPVSVDKGSIRKKCYRSNIFRNLFLKLLQRLSKIFGLLRKKPAEMDMMWHHFQETPRISPHQVSIVITSLENCEVTLPWARAHLSLWAQTGALEQLKTATSNPKKSASVILKFVNFYEDFFQVNCPLSKIDLVSLPDSGYISGFGVIIEMEEVLLSEVELMEVNRLAHSVAKLWLDGLVTFSWWSDLWYTWSLAEHLATLAIDRVYPTWNIINRVLVTRIESIYKEDSKDEVTTVLMPITTPEEVMGSYYNVIFYDKGPVLIHMVHSLLGNEMFKKGLKEFLLKFQSASASTEDLWTSLMGVANEAKVLPSGVELKEVMENWLSQTGLPIVIATRNYETSEISISQKPSNEDGSAEDTHSCWWIPITYSTTQQPTFSDTKPKQWLNCEKKVYAFHIEVTEREWIILNNKMAGLYRVYYDDENWKLIATALMRPDFSEIDVLNRVQLLTDSWDFAPRRKLGYQIAFNILSYLQHEKEYLPWKVALDRLKDVKDKLYRAPKSNLFQEYMQKLLIEVFTKFEALEKPRNEEEKLQRSFIVKWACEFNVLQCNQWAKGLFLKWKNSRKVIPKDVRRVVFCKGAQEGEWSYLQEYYKKSDNSNEQKQILFALSCTNDNGLLKKYLEWSIDANSPIPAQYCFDAFRKVVKNKVGYSIAWDFFFENIETISDHSGRGSDVVAMYLTALVDQVISEEEIGKAREMVEKHRDQLQGIDEEIEDAFSEAEERIKWFQQNYDPIISAIAQIQL